MKKSITMLSAVLLFILSIIGLADAATLHSGNITSDETWTLAGSPHIIEYGVGVSGGTLTIEPGVEVKFSATWNLGSLKIQGEGRLIAQGTDTQKIIFTSNEVNKQPGDWWGITFWNAASGSIIENAIIEYGSDGDGESACGNIKIKSSNPTIKNCIIRRGLHEGITISYQSTSVISGCRFEENGRNGIVIFYSSPVLDANTFINNGSYPVYVYNSSEPEPVIYGTNTFSGNNPDQIMFYVGRIIHNHTLRYVGIPYFFAIGIRTVENNSTFTIEPGVEVRFEKGGSSRLTIGEIGGTSGKLIAQGTDTQKIIFTSNEVNPQPGDWHNIYFRDTASDDSIIENAIIEYGGDSGNIHIKSSNPTIKNCIIRRSLSSGIHMSGSSSPDISCCDITENEYGIGNFSSSGSPNLTNNNIFGNFSFGIYNYSPGAITLNAINNWWGDASGPSGVGPGSGDAVSSDVIYDPWLTEISFCTMRKAMPWIPLLLLDD